MKALEHLLIQELAQIRATEATLQRAYGTLRNASDDQIVGFVANLADLDHRTHRVEKLLNAISQPGLAAA
jgi:hypothetical protein